MPWDIMRTESIVSAVFALGGKALPAGTLGCFAGILALASTKWEDGE